MIPPGGEGEIKVTLRPKGNHTQITKKIVVHSNDPEQPRFALTMQGSLLVDIVAQPSAVSIRDLKVGAKGSESFSLQLTENSTAEIVSVTIEDQENFSIRKVDTIGDADASYEVSFRGRDSVGISSTRVQVKTTGPNTPELTIPVRASAAKNLRYINNLRFTTRNGVLQERVLRISSRHGDAPKIGKVEDPDGLLDIEVLEPQGPMASVRMQVREHAYAALDEGGRTGAHRLIVHTNDREEPKLELDYRIMAESKPRTPAGGSRR